MASLGEAILRALRARRGDPEAEEESRAAAEEINKVLPEKLSGRRAVLLKREQMRQIDEMLKGT
jgi:hypothetical protein